MGHSHYAKKDDKECPNQTLMMWSKVILMYWRTQSNLRLFLLSVEMIAVSTTMNTTTTRMMKETEATTMTTTATNTTMLSLIWTIHYSRQPTLRNDVVLLASVTLVNWMTGWVNNDYLIWRIGDGAVAWYEAWYDDEGYSGLKSPYHMLDYQKVRVRRREEEGGGGKSQLWREGY